MEITKNVLFRSSPSSQLYISKTILIRDKVDGKLYWAHRNWAYSDLSESDLVNYEYLDKRHISWIYNNNSHEWVIPYEEGDL